MSEAVREGRKKCGDEAWQKRQDDMESDADDGENGEDEDGIEDPMAPCQTWVTRIDGRDFGVRAMYFTFHYNCNCL
jgi:hypothetical protein